MCKVLNTTIKAGSERTSEPRPIGELIDEYFEESNEPLAVGYRKWQQECEATGKEMCDE